MRREAGIDFADKSPVLALFKVNHGAERPVQSVLVRLCFDLRHDEPCCDSAGIRNQKQQNDHETATERALARHEEDLSR